MNRRHTWDSRFGPFAGQRHERDALAASRPRTVEFRFSAPLESPEWLWMRGDRMGVVGWTPPKVGETVVVTTSL